MYSQHVTLSTYSLISLFLQIVYREPVIGPRSQGIVNQYPAINNKLATKPNPDPTLTIALTLTLN